jgi:hypothetical protein
MVEGGGPKPDNDPYPERDLVRVFADPGTSLTYLHQAFAGENALTAFAPTSDGGYVPLEPRLWLDETSSTGLAQPLSLDRWVMSGQILIVASRESLASFGVDQDTKRLRALNLLPGAASSGHTESTVSMASNPNGLVAAARPTDVRLFTVASSGQLSFVGEVSLAVRDYPYLNGRHRLAFHPDGRFLYVLSEAGLMIYKADSEGGLQPFALEPDALADAIAVTRADS